MLKKYKKLPLILTGLAGVALLTTGFSAWVISGSNSEAATDNLVNIAVGGVTDNRLTVKAELIEEPKPLDGQLKFDAKVDNQGPITGPEGSEEDMTFGGTVKFSVTKGKYDIESVLDKVEFSLQFASPEGQFNSIYSNAVGAKSYLLAPIVVGDKLELNKTDVNNWLTSETDSEYYTENGSYLKYKFDVTPNLDANIITVQFEFGYCWGSAFLNKNPVELTDNIDDVVTALNDLNSLNGATDLFTLTITPVLTADATA